MYLFIHNLHILSMYSLRAVNSQMMVLWTTRQIAILQSKSLSLKTNAYGKYAMLYRIRKKTCLYTRKSHVFMVILVSNQTKTMFNFLSSNPNCRVAYQIVTPFSVTVDMMVLSNSHALLHCSKHLLKIWHRIDLTLC